MHALVFDLDGTLVDTVYAHVLAWQRALCESDINVDGYRLHRHVGSSGDLIVRYAQREVGRELSPDEQHTIHERHGELFRQLLAEELEKIKLMVGEKQFAKGSYEEASALFDELTTNDEFVEFLTLRGAADRHGRWP